MATKLDSTSLCFELFAQSSLEQEWFDIVVLAKPFKRLYFSRCRLKMYIQSLQTKKEMLIIKLFSIKNKNTFWFISQMQYDTTYTVRTY